MGFRAVIARPFASYIHQQTREWSSRPGWYQEKILDGLVEGGRRTLFGKDHGFESIRSHDDFKERVPIRDYEQLKPYVEKILNGDPDVLWKGKPAYLAKTSGTTSGTKYIPITRESIPNHINSARNALLSYVHETGKSAFIDGGLIFLSGSPELDKKGASIPGAFREL